MFRLGTFNVQAVPVMDQGDVNEDTGKVRDYADIVVWQEIGPDRYKDSVAGLAPEFRTFQPEGLGNTTPISWRPDKFEVEARGVELLHESMSGVMAARGIVWVKLRLRGTRQRYVVVNTHYVPGAWGPNGTSTRQTVWNIGNRRHKALIARFVRSDITVIGGGDFNKEGQVLGAGIEGRPVRYLTDTGIDHLYVVPNARLRLVHLWTEIYRANSDHNFKAAGVHFKRRLL